MKRQIAIIVAAGALLPATAGAKAQEPVEDVRVVVQSVDAQSTAERRAEIRKRQEAIRERQRTEARQHLTEQSEKIDRTLKLGARGELVLTNLSGDVVVTRGGGSDVRIEALKTARARTAEDAREMLSRVEIEVTEHGSRGEVKVIFPGHRSEIAREKKVVVNRNMNVSVAFTVTAPENTRIAVNSLSGDIKITGIKGELSLATLSGDVAVREASRNVSVKSTSGQVEITNTTSENTVEANSVSGDVLVRNVKAPRMQLGTISGRVMIQDSDTARLEAQSLSGTVELASPLQKNGRYDLQSHAGTIRIVLAGNVGFELDANTFNGTVQSDIALKDEVTGTGPGPRRASGGRIRSLRGIYGDGSALIDVTTFSGNVVVVKK